MRGAAPIAGIGLPGAGEAPDPACHGPKAARLHAAAAAGLPVPPGFVLAAGADLQQLPIWLDRLAGAAGQGLGDAAAPLLLAVRPSAAEPARDFAPAILGIGLDAATEPALTKRFGARASADLFRRLRAGWAASVAGFHAEDIEDPLLDALKAAGVDDEALLPAEELRSLGNDV